MSVDEVLEPLKSWTAQGRKAGVATLVGYRRSAPRPPGARFAASEASDVAGSVSSGCVESDLHEHIQQVLESGEPRLVDYGITDEMAAEVGLACGGEIEVLVAPYEAESPVWPALEDVLAEDAAAVLFTGLSDEIRGRQLLLRPDGTRVGTLGEDALDEAAGAAATEYFSTGGTGTVELGGAGAAVFAEAFLPSPRLAIVGASPIAQALCHLADYLGMAVTIVDPRTAFAKPERFPEAVEVITEWPDEGLARFGLDRWASVVVLGHDRKLDVPALAAALRAGCGYVGQIGGRRTQKLRREALRELGFSEEELERIHGPVGLDIGSDTPEEIALSIMAELLAVRRGKAP